MANLSIVIVPAKKLSNGRHRVRIAVAHRSQTRYISTQFILDSANQMKNGRVVKHDEGGNLAASKIRNLECPSYEICLIDYGCGKFNRKIHIMEQYP